MNVSYSSPIALSWARMQRMLFQPFRFESWLTLGLAAFLARIGSSLRGSSNAFNWRNHSNTNAAQLPEAVRERIMGWLTNPAVLMGIAMVLVFFLALMLLFAWLSARAEFVFLENIATERIAFGEPWGRYARLGQSLFLFRAALSFLYLVPLAIIGVPLVHIISQFLHGQEFQWSMFSGMLLSITLACVCLIAIGFVNMCTEDFVVPLMFARDIRAREAWGAFLPLLQAHVGDFFAYAVLLVLLEFGVVLAVLVAGVLTCCVGLILVSIPYINAVVLLPLHVTRRGMGPEFMAQFGPEWATFPPRPQTVIEPAPPAF